MAIDETRGVVQPTTTSTVQDVGSTTGQLGDHSVSPGIGSRIKAGFSSFFQGIKDFFTSLPTRYENWQEGRAVSSAKTAAANAAQSVAEDLAGGTVTKKTADRLQTLMAKAERAGQDPQDVLMTAMRKLSSEQLSSIATSDLDSVATTLKQHTRQGLEDAARTLDALYSSGIAKYDGTQVRAMIGGAEARIDEFVSEIGNAADLVLLGQSRIGEGNAAAIRPEALMRFFEKNFEKCTSTEFWSDPMARGNVDNFGAALALTVLERIKAGGEVTAQDIADLQRTLSLFDNGERPGSMFYIEPAPDVAALLGPDGVGELTDEKLQTLTQVVYDRFMGPDAGYEVNMSTGQARSIRATFGDETKTGEERLSALRETMDGVLTSQYLGEKNLVSPFDRAP